MIEDKIEKMSTIVVKQQMAIIERRCFFQDAFL